MKRKLVALLAAFAAASAFAAAAHAAPALGVADDATKYAEDGGTSLFAKLRDLGASENRIVVYWDHARPAEIQERGFLDRSLPAARALGIRIVFAVYPRDPRAFADETDARVAQFAAYLKLLAARYPQVTNFVILNEPNEAFFLYPQSASPAIALKVLAAGYDALKSSNPAITVAGLGLSPDGNDRTSTSPVRFLAELGAAYRRSERAAPLMDELSLHLYPRDSARNDHSTRADWPNIGPADVARVKQAVWDAFAGTAQPVFPEPGGGGTLRLRIGELGWQVAVQPSVAWAHTGAENVAVTDEGRQAAIYAAMVRQLGCDPAVSAINIFHLVDDQDLRQYQSGLLRADRSERPSFSSVRAAYAGGCSTPRTWTHSSGVIGAAAFFDGAGSPAATAAEDADAVGVLLRVSGPEELSAGRAARAFTGGDEAVVAAAVRNLVKANRRARFELPRPAQPGWYAYAIRLSAWANPERTQTFVSRVFRVE